MRKKTIGREAPDFPSRSRECAANNHPPGWLAAAVLAAATLAASSLVASGCSCDSAMPTRPETTAAPQPRPPGRPGTRFIAELPGSDTSCVPVSGPWSCEPVFKQVKGGPPLPLALEKFVAFTWSITGPTGEVIPPQDSEIADLKGELAAAGVTALEEDKILFTPQGQGNAFTRESKRWLRRKLHVQAGGMPHLLEGAAPRAGVDLILIDSAPTSAAEQGGAPPNWGLLEHGRILWSVAGDLLCPDRLEGDAAPACTSRIFTKLALPQLTDLLSDEVTGGYFGQESRLAESIQLAVDEWRVRATKPNGKLEHARAVLNLSLGREPLEGECEPEAEPDPTNAASRAVLMALRHAACFDVDRIAAAGNWSGDREEPTCPAVWESLPAPTREECERLEGKGYAASLPYSPHPPPSASGAPSRLVTGVGALDYSGHPIAQTRPWRPPFAAVGMFASDDGASAEGGESMLAPISGTSVSSLVMASAVAIARSYAPGLTGPEVLNVLHAAGAPVVNDGVPEPASFCYRAACEVRAVNICMAVKALCESNAGGAAERCPPGGVTCQPPPESPTSSPPLPRHLAREMNRFLQSMSAGADVHTGSPMSVEEALGESDAGKWVRPMPTRPPCNPCGLKMAWADEASYPADVFVNLDAELPASIELYNQRLVIVGEAAGSLGMTALQYNLSQSTATAPRSMGQPDAGPKAESGAFKIDIPDHFKTHSAMLLWDVWSPDASDATRQALRSTARQEIVIHRAKDACEAADGAGDSDESSAIYGNLEDALSGASIAANAAEHAWVELDGEPYEVNDSGAFSIPGVPSNRPIKLAAGSDAHAPLVRTLVARAGAATYVDVPMTSWCGIATFNAATSDVDVECPSGARVKLRKGTLDCNNASCEAVTLKLAHLSAAGASAVRAYPGDFRTLGGDRMEVFGMIHVEARGSNGELIDIKPGELAVVSLPVTPNAPSPAAPSRLELYHFHEASVGWSLEATSPGCAQGLCGALLPRLGSWSTAKVIETTCVRACAENPLAQAAAGGLLVEASGLDYHAVTSEITGSDGCACFDVKRDSKADLRVRSAIDAPSPVVINEAEGGSCEECACKELPAPISVAPPQMWIELTWGESPLDLNLHMSGPCDAMECACPPNKPCPQDRFHVSYASFGDLLASPYTILNTDDKVGFGPEIIATTKCLPGTYRVAVQNDSTTPNIHVSGAVVNLHINNTSYAETIPPTNAGEELVWVVGDLKCNHQCACSFEKSPSPFLPDAEASYHP